MNEMNEAKDVRCVFCERHNCDCEESKALAVVGRTYRDILERKENRSERRRTPADTKLDDVRLEQFGPEVCYYDGGEIRRTGNIKRWRDSCQTCGYIRRAC